MKSEPVGVFAALTSAATATVAILLVVDVDPDLVAAITAAVTGWIGLAAALVRGRVTPTAKAADSEG